MGNIFCITMKRSSLQERVSKLMPKGFMTSTQGYFENCLKNDTTAFNYVIQQIAWNKSSLVLKLQKGNQQISHLFTMTIKIECISKSYYMPSWKAWGQIKLKVVGSGSAFKREYLE